MYRIVFTFALSAMLTLAMPAIAAAQSAHDPAVMVGITHWQAGRFDTAVAAWRAPAERGDPEAQFRLAQALRDGQGIAPDPAKAEDLFGKAARQGHMEASDEYGVLLFQSARIKEALPWLQASAERGEPRARYYLGIASFNGDDMPKDWVRAYPANCPPTVIVLQTELAVAEAFAKRLDGDLKCHVRMATDGANLAQGSIYIAADPELHAVVEAGTPPRLRLVARDPIDGVRPSANLLFGTIARAAMPSVGAVLSGLGDDGAKGLKLMSDAGSRTFAQHRSSAVVAQAPAAALAANPSLTELPIEDMTGAILTACSIS